MSESTIVRELGLSRKLVRFAMVGLSGVTVDMVVLYLLTDGIALWRLGVPLQVAKPLAAIVALCNNFYWNEKWTFHAEATGMVRRHSVFLRLGKFTAICAVGIVIATGVLLVLVERLGWNQYGANIAAILVATGWNFGMNMTITWNVNGNRSEVVGEHERL